MSENLNTAMETLVPVTLIVGADSFIGGALMANFQRMGVPVVGTTRRREAMDKSLLYLDLLEDMSRWDCPYPIGVAIICAGITILNECKNDPEGSRRVNVEGISTLTRNLSAKGVFIVYLSTNAVFDGSKPNRLPDEVSPATEYGRQKIKAERQILQLGDSIAIVRLTKVMGPQMPIFSAWSEDLRNDKIISPFSDLTMTAVPLPYVISTLKLIADTKSCGIFQISSDRDISYAEAAYLGARALNVNKNLIQPISISQSDMKLEHHFQYTILL